MARITTIVALGVGLCLAAGCTTKHLSSGREDLLVLSYQEFDQTEGSGWRTLAEESRMLWHTEEDDDPELGCRPEALHGCAKTA